jgi:uracil phosphoribosyltransferase
MSGAFRVVEHPLIEHKLLYMRDLNRPHHEFSRLLKEVGMLMAMEISKRLLALRESKTVKLSLPEGKVGTYSGTVINSRKVVIVPLLRAGLIMAEGVREVMPFARTGYIGLRQNSNHSETLEYLVNLPSPAGRTFIVVDPMIGTGNSISKTFSILREHVDNDDCIKFVGLIASKQAEIKIKREYPSIDFYIAAVDPDLDAKTGRVVPGVGIISERIFGI